MRVKRVDLPVLAGGTPVRKKFLYFFTPQITKEDIESVVKVLKSGWITTGPVVFEFEKKFNEYVGVKYSSAVSSCTAALHLALIVSGIGRDDEVITTPLTFASVANVIVHTGARPIFADVEKASGNIDPLEVEMKINKKTKAIIVTHLFGRPANLNELSQIAKKHKLVLIEDCAHALGARYKGKHVGTTNDFGAFSFYATKNLTCGEGGALTTNDKNYWERTNIYKMQGLSRNSWGRYIQKNVDYYKLEAAGYKYNLADMNAALGTSQLKRFAKSQARREKIWNQYKSAFLDLPVIPLPDEEKNMVHARHIYPLILDLSKLKVDRQKIRQALALENIGTSIHFVSLHLHPFYKKLFRFKPSDFPNSFFLSQRLVSLPLSQGMKDSDVEDVIYAVKKVLKYYAE